MTLNRVGHETDCLRFLSGALQGAEPGNTLFIELRRPQQPTWVHVPKHNTAAVLAATASWVQPKRARDIHTKAQSN